VAVSGGVLVLRRGNAQALMARGRLRRRGAASSGALRRRDHAWHGVAGACWAWLCWRVQSLSRSREGTSRFREVRGVG
jgi:hypothetical protein